ncbi:MAG: DNA polymerase I, partial [Gemmatimonadetes bacterium]|nr:DNA polymerase I [Gemmatimonadota bacterium]
MTTTDAANRALGISGELQLQDRSVLCLLDGMALAYRGHFALINNPVMNAKGVNTSAPLVFTNTLLEIIDRFEPTHLAAVFDTPKPTHRHEAFPEYKAQRDKMPEDLGAAIPYVISVCEGFSVPVLRVDGWEADDVIGTLAREAEAAGVTTYMITPDKDYAQLVDEHTFLFRPGRGATPPQLLGVPDVLAKWNVERIDQVVDVMGLMGDTSDNIPGVPGIGEKTAQKLIAEFGSVESLLERVEELKGKRKQTLIDNHDQALLSKQLVTIDCSVPLDTNVNQLRRQPADASALKGLFAELEFNALGQRLFGKDYEMVVQRVAAGGDAAQAGEIQTIEDVEHEYSAVTTVDERLALIDAARQKGSFSIDLETTSLDPKTCDIVGLAIAIEPHQGVFVPFPEDRGDVAILLEEFRPLLQDPTVEKVGHNIKYDITVLLWHGILVQGPLFDTMVAAFLVVPDLRRSLDYLAQAMLGYRPVPITDLIGEKGEGQKSMREIDLAELTQYAVEDADIALQLAQVLRSMLDESNQRKLYDEVEAPLIPVLATMERAGIRVDAACLKVISDDLAAQIEVAAGRIEELAGEPFNLNSPSQMGMILFEKLQLDPNARRTAKSKQYKTDEMVLTRLSHEHEIARQILHYRLCTKLKSTYLDMLPGAILPATGRVHTHYEQAVAATGRMQSSNPNLQNIPIRTEQGREIRRAFIAEGPEWTLLAADYSQIELRIIAEICGDERMNQAFRDEEDIHTVTASRLYSLPPEMVDEDMRRQSKTVNFGIIYGISAFGL